MCQCWRDRSTHYSCFSSPSLLTALRTCLTRFGSVVLILAFIFPSALYAETFSDKGRSVDSSGDVQPLICYENVHYPPFMYEKDKVPASKPGILLELLKQPELGVTFRYQRKPWKRCIKMVTEGRADGIFAAIWLEERDQWGRYPPVGKQDGVPADSRYRLWQAEYRIFVNHTTSLSWDGQRFSGIMDQGISAPPGYVAEKRLRALDVFAPGEHRALEGLKLVAKGRLDGYVIEYYTGLQTIQRLPPSMKPALDTLSIPFFKADWFLVFSHRFVNDHPELAQSVWQGLKDISPEIRTKIIRKYSDSTATD